MIKPNIPDPANTWHPISIEALLDGGLTLPQPGVLRTVNPDGAPGPCLLYPGRVHTFSAANSTAVELFYLAAIRDVLCDPTAGRVMLVLSGEEQEPAVVLSRLLDAGAPVESVRYRLDIYAPEVTPLRPTRRAGWLQALTKRYALVVLPSLAEQLRLSNVDPDEHAQLIYWMREVPLTIARETGAAVLIGYVLRGGAVAPPLPVLALATAAFAAARSDASSDMFTMLILKDRIGGLDSNLSYTVDRTYIGEAVVRAEVRA